jgi:hypothetical protein
MDIFASYSHRSTESAFLGTPSSSGYHDHWGTLYTSLPCFGDLSGKQGTFDTFTTFEDRGWCLLCWTGKSCSLNHISSCNMIPESQLPRLLALAHIDLGLRTSYLYLVAVMEYVKLSTYISASLMIHLTVYFSNSTLLCKHARSFRRRSREADSSLEYW